MNERANVPPGARSVMLLLDVLNQAAKPTGRVCLKHRPEITGTVLGGSADPDRVRVYWHDTDQETHCLVANLAASAMEADEDQQGDRR